VTDLKRRLTAHVVGIQTADINDQLQLGPHSIFTISSHVSISLSPMLGNRFEQQIQLHWGPVGLLPLAIVWG
jgi:hypothetical protein